MLTPYCLVLVMATLPGATGPAALRPIANAQDVKQALSLPGTDVGCLTNEQADCLARVLDGQMRLHSSKQASFADFIQTVKLMRSTGAARGMRVFPGKRTLQDICREIGVLAQREQRFEREGRKQEIAASLQRICAARSSGASSEELAKLEHELIERGGLSVSAVGECARIHSRLEKLARMLVAGHQVIVSQANARGMTVADFLATRPRSAKPAVRAPIR